MRKEGINIGNLYTSIGSSAGMGAIAGRVISLFITDSATNIIFDLGTAILVSIFAFCIWKSIKWWHPIETKDNVVKRIRTHLIFMNAIIVLICSILLSKSILDSFNFDGVYLTTLQIILFCIAAVNSICMTYLFNKKRVTKRRITSSKLLLYWAIFGFFVIISLVNYAPDYGGFLLFVGLLMSFLLTIYSMFLEKD